MKAIWKGGEKCPKISTPATKAFTACSKRSQNIHIFLHSSPEPRKPQGNAKRARRHLHMEWAAWRGGNGSSGNPHLAYGQSTQPCSRARHRVRPPWLFTRRPSLASCTSSLFTQRWSQFFLRDYHGIYAVRWGQSSSFKTVMLRSTHKHSWKLLAELVQENRRP